MRLNRFYICLCLAAFSTAIWGQTPVVPGTSDEEHSKTHHDRPINLGIKGGFTSSLFLVSNFSINGVAIDEVQNNYKIGNFGSVFIRINFNRHFLQPEYPITSIAATLPSISLYQKTHLPEPRPSKHPSPHLSTVSTSL